MLQRSVALYDRLEAETGQAIDWKKVGSLRLACSPDRLMEIKRAATMAKSFGLEMEHHLAEGGAGSLPDPQCRRTCWRPPICRPTAMSIRPASRRRWPRARA